MTWTKLSDDFPEDCARVGLSDAAVRTHLEGLVWAGCSPVISLALPTRPIPRPPPMNWSPWDSGRSSRTGDRSNTRWTCRWSEVIMARRKANAERQRRKRLKAAGLPDPDAEGMPVSRRDDPRDMPRDDTRDPGLGRTGQDCSGEEVLRTTGN